MEKPGWKSWILILAALIIAGVTEATWAAPGQDPHRQTVPTRTPVPQPSLGAPPEAPPEEPPGELPQPPPASPEATPPPTDAPVPATATLTPDLPTATLVVATDTPQPAAATLVLTERPSPKPMATLTEPSTSTPLPSPPTPTATYTSSAPKRANGLVPLLGFALVAILVALLVLWARGRQGEEG